MIKPKPVQPAVAGGFTVDDFGVDEDADLRNPLGCGLTRAAGRGS